MRQSDSLARLAHSKHKAINRNSKAISSSNSSDNSKTAMLRLVAGCSDRSSNRKVDISDHQINLKVARRNITLHHKILMMISLLNKSLLITAKLW